MNAHRETYDINCSGCAKRSVGWVSVAHGMNTLWSKGWKRLDSQPAGRHSHWMLCPDCDPEAAAKP